MKRVFWGLVGLGMGTAIGVGVMRWASRTADRLAPQSLASELVHAAGDWRERVSVALEQAGVPAFTIKAAQEQMKHLGRRRLERLYDWLLEIDQGVKGASPLPPRTQLERLVVRLARKLA